MFKLTLKKALFTFLSTNMAFVATHAYAEDAKTQPPIQEPAEPRGIIIEEPAKPAEKPYQEGGCGMEEIQKPNEMEEIQKPEGIKPPTMPETPAKPTP